MLRRLLASIFLDINELVVKGPKLVCLAFAAGKIAPDFNTILTRRVTFEFHDLVACPIISVMQATNQTCLTFKKASAK